MEEREWVGGLRQEERREFELFHLQILRWFDHRNFMFHCGMLQL